MITKKEELGIAEREYTKGLVEANRRLSASCAKATSKATERYWLEVGASRKTYENERDRINNREGE